MYFCQAKSKSIQVNSNWIGRRWYYFRNFPTPPPPPPGKVPIADSKQHPGEYNIRPASDYLYIFIYLYHVIVPTLLVPTLSVTTLLVPTLSDPTLLVPTLSVPTLSVPTLSVPTLLVPTLSVPTLLVPT